VGQNIGSDRGKSRIKLTTRPVLPHLTTMKRVSQAYQWGGTRLGNSATPTRLSIWRLTRLNSHLSIEKVGGRTTPWTHGLICGKWGQR